jgi:hypothetical protein
MAELIRVAYLKIALAAAIPALLYYSSRRLDPFRGAEIQSGADPQRADSIREKDSA